MFVLININLKTHVPNNFIISKRYSLRNYIFQGFACKSTIISIIVILVPGSTTPRLAKLPRYLNNS